MRSQQNHFTGSTTDKLEENTTLTCDCVIKASRTLQEVVGSLQDTYVDKVRVINV